MENLKAIAESMAVGIEKLTITGSEFKDTFVIDDTSDEDFVYISVLKF